MVSSITSGQLASRTGHYKRYMVAGIAIAAAAIFSLTGLTPETPFWQEAISMVFVGLGMGMVMPLMNLAVQNEFEQKDLGAATSTVQLTRGLGSTLGTAVLSGILTAGIIGSLGAPEDIPFIQKLKQSPAASSMFSGDITTDTLLAVNTQKDTIREAATQGIQAAPLPPAVQEQQLQAFKDMQDTYSKDVINAFADALHTIFKIASGLMAVALVLVLFVKERPLRDNVKVTPGE
jgi:MFS family permease